MSFMAKGRFPPARTTNHRWFLIEIKACPRVEAGLAKYSSEPSTGVDLLKRRGGYLAFVGRISPEKRPDRAISIARALGISLKIAAKVGRADEVYFKMQIEPLLEAGGVEFIGEINDHQKTQFLGDAQALLFPIDWPEPFGLSMIEAMACGTPVLAFRCGSVPEVVEDGITGTILETMEGAIAALPRVIALDRIKVRQRFEQRFSGTRMANDYVGIYRSLLAKSAQREQQEIELSPDGKDSNILRRLVA